MLAWSCWFLQYNPFMHMGRVTYHHHYLPTLYFAVLVLVHLLDHFLWNDVTARTSMDWSIFLRTGRVVSTKLNPFVHDTAATVPGKPLSPQIKNVTFAATAAFEKMVFFWCSGS